MNVTDPFHYLRKERNFLLNQSDWEMLKALETGVNADALKTYRQALRDLPSTATPTLDDNGNLQNVNWPDKPT